MYPPESAARDALAAIDQHGELDAARPTEVDQLIECGPIVRPV
jgi:hypothetical protein